jgi:predicted GH43/DUF377 family glycosyl hydrolase
VFNPAAVLEDDKVHFLYRALGEDGISRLGYAVSSDGIHIDERLDKPAYVDRRPYGRYVALEFISGGGLGGCEDPRLTRLEDDIHMIYVSFDGYNPPRLALTSIARNDFLGKKWKWGSARLISPPGIVAKSGCLFPEKIRGKYVIMHRVFPDILLDYVDSLDFKEGEYLKGQYKIPVREDGWDSLKIGAGAPPLKTPYGWLLIYYAVDKEDASHYKLGAMLLDLKHPEKVLHRSDEPVLEPMEWYENEGHKAGVVYPCGAVIKDKTLFVYYGGADTFVCAARARLDTFLEQLMRSRKPKLRRVSSR